MHTVQEFPPVSSRVIDGMIAKLRAGGHLRCHDLRLGQYWLVTSKRRYAVNPHEFDVIFKRGAITNACEHSYADGIIWVAREVGAA